MVFLSLLICAISVSGAEPQFWNFRDQKLMSRKISQGDPLIGQGWDPPQKNLPLQPGADLGVLGRPN